MNFDQFPERKGTYCTQWDYTMDRFGREDILPFSISDMDIACPPSLIQTLKERMDHPIFGYSRWRNPDYLNAITGWYETRYETAIEPSWILYSPSVMYSIAQCIKLLSDPHDGVVILTPAYNAFFEVIENNDRRCITSSLHLVDHHYVINFDDLEEKLSKSKILLLCNPHNPVGRMWNEDEITRMLELAEMHHCWVVSDDIHMDMCLASTPVSILKYQKQHPHMVVLNSISKSFNVPALSGSYAIIPDPEIRALFERQTRYTDFVNSPAILNVIATIHVYNTCRPWLDQLQSYLLENLEYTQQYLSQHFPQINIIVPDATYLLWLDLRALKMTDEEIQDRLLNIGNVGIMSGSVYGDDGTGFLRFHIGCPQSKVADGLHRLTKALKPF